MNYKKNVQRPTRQIPFYTRFLRWVQGLFRRQQPEALHMPEPVRKFGEGAYNATGTYGGTGFGNPLSPRSKTGRWWIPPDARTESPEAIQ